MKDNTILTEEERVELRNVYAKIRGYDFDLEEAELSGEAESLKNEAIRNEWDTLYEDFESLLAKKMEEREDRFLSYLLQRFNDYEVPLKMTAEEVRDLIIKFYKEYGK